MSKRLKFIFYNGEYPSLCYGNLIMELDGKKIEFPEDCLNSGGSVWFDDNCDEHVEEGDWSISNFPTNFPEELKNEAENLVNENVPKGCCGGCV